MDNVRVDFTEGQIFTKNKRREYDRFKTGPQ